MPPKGTKVPKAPKAAKAEKSTTVKPTKAAQSTEASEPTEDKRGGRASITNRDVELVRIFGHFIQAIAGDVLFGKGDHSLIDGAVDTAWVAAGFKHRKVGRQKFKEAWTRLCNLDLPAPGNSKLPELKNNQEKVKDFKSAVRTSGKRKKKEVVGDEEEDGGRKSRVKREQSGEIGAEGNGKGEGEEADKPVEGKGTEDEEEEGEEKEDDELEIGREGEDDEGSGSDDDDEAEEEL